VIFSICSSATGWFEASSAKALAVLVNKAIETAKETVFFCKVFEVEFIKITMYFLIIKKVAIQKDPAMGGYFFMHECKK
jgi:hypothetical protein